MTSDPERHQRAMQAFYDVCDAEPEERTRLLDAACGDDVELRAIIEGLLAADDDPLQLTGDDGLRARLEGWCEDLDTREAPELSSEALPDRIGDFLIKRRLGVGGMGIVYLAEQDAPQRLVALKMVRLSSISASSLRRFRLETEVLGVLKHPGIAQIFETGAAQTSEGVQPYFVMEYVEGVSLVDYADQKNLGVAERLALFLEICDAVHHAHSHGVIHRDLKPDNILITEGSGSGAGHAKVLDFGVARTLGSDLHLTSLQTEVGQLVGTLAYMSPEQASGRRDQLDTRSDVYALGVVLYQLLSGTRPLDVGEVSLPEAVRVIQERDPAGLGSLDSRFRGDLETITATALQKDKERRYQSAAALAADIRRYLRHEPITARPASAIYQLRKLARRHVGFVVGAAIAVVILIGGIVATTVEAVRANRNAEESRRNAILANAATEREISERKRAQAKAEEATAVRQFFEEVLMLAAPAKRGFDVKLVVALDEIARRIDEPEFTRYLQFEAAVCTALGTIYYNLGRYEDAESFTVRAIRRIDESPEPDTYILRHALRNLANVCNDQSRYRESLTHLNRARAIAADQGIEASTDDCERLLALGNALKAVEDFKGAREAYQTAYDTYAATEDGDIGVSAALGNLATVDKLERKFDAAVRRYTESRRLLRAAGQHETPNFLATTYHLTDLYGRLGKRDEAVRLGREAYALGKKVLGPRHSNVAMIAFGLGKQLYLAKEIAEAEKVILEGLEVLEAAPSMSSSGRAASALTLLGSLYVTEERFEEAEKSLRKAERLFRDLLGPTHGQVLYARRRIADLRLAQGRQEEAEVIMRELVGLAEEKQQQGGRLAIYQRELAKVLIAGKKFDEAQELLAAALVVARKHLGDDNPETKLILKQISALEQARAADEATSER